MKSTPHSAPRFGYLNSHTIILWPRHQYPDRGIEMTGLDFIMDPQISNYHGAFR